MKLNFILFCPFYFFITFIRLNILMFNLFLFIYDAFITRVEYCLLGFCSLGSCPVSPFIRALGMKALSEVASFLCPGRKGRE